MTSLTIDLDFGEKEKFKKNNRFASSAWNLAMRITKI